MLENTLTISHNNSRAEIDSTGAYVRSLSLKGLEVLKPSGDGKDTHGGMAVMLPFANRIRNGEYGWEGKNYHLPRNNGIHSIHGLTREVEWNIVHRGGNSVSLSYNLISDGYPVPLYLKVGYQLGASDFKVSFEARNEGRITAPFMAGMHPYFNYDSTWTLESRRNLLMLNYRDRYFPDGTFESIKAENIGSKSGKTYDNTFIAGSPVVLKSKGRRISITTEEMPFLVVYNGEYSQGKSVALEPMTSAPDSFNNRIGLIELPPGESYHCGASFQLEK